MPSDLQDSQRWYEVREAVASVTPCTVRTAEKAVMKRVAVVVLVGVLGGPPVADAQQAHHNADGRR
jgi:hypothetical protein